MKKNRSKWLVLIHWMVALGWTALVLKLSVQTGEETTGLSLGIIDRILSWLPGLTKLWDYHVLHALLRKGAHVAVFGIWGLAVATAASTTVDIVKGNWKKAVIAVLLLCAVIAVMTEVVKLGIPGRHLDWGEAVLNVISTWAGVGLVALVRRLAQQARRSRA